MKSTHFLSTYYTHKTDQGWISRDSESGWVRFPTVAFSPSKVSISIMWPTRPSLHWLQVAVCRINHYPANVEDMVSS